MSTRASVDDKSLRPHADTATKRPSTAPHSGTPIGTRPSPPHLEATPEEKAVTKEVNQDGTKPDHQRFVLTDPVAFRYLEEDPSTTVLDRRRELNGYECYIVEQWTTSRTHPTFVITTYTGDPSHAVIVGVLSVPTDERQWSPRLRVYFKALNQYHARRRDTPLGILMVTNLSGFPSSLTVIPVPDGDLRKHRFDFFVNENLKRLGCSGRVGLTLAPPSGATVAKFHQLYRTSDKNDIFKAVIELVKLCQSALMLFDKLEIDYADGLLCDVTERAINDWWVEIGSEQYNIEPHDGILGPTTVAGLLGLLMGARNRLHAVNSPVSKDPFDVEAMKRGIGHFQKQQRMPSTVRTRRLDRRTLDRLHKATQKAADHEGWTMPKVLKNTAAELSGKGGEMLVDAVGRRDRAGIAEIETCDIERFVELVYGDRCKWLWKGKPIKHQKERDRAEHHASTVEGGAARLHKGLVFKHDEHGGFTWTARKSTQDGPAGREARAGDGRDSFDDIAAARPAAGAEEAETDDEDFGGVVKRDSGLKIEAKKGLGKFKGAIGLRGHHQAKPSVDDDSPRTPVEDTTPNKRRPLFKRAHSSPISSPNSPKSPPVDARLAAIAEPAREGRISTDAERVSRQADHDGRQPFPGKDADPSRESLAASSSEQVSRDQQEGSSGSGTHTVSGQASEQPSGTVTADASIAGSIYNGIDMNETLPTGPETEKDVSNLLRRTLSLSHFISVQIEQRSDEAYPRHLSFSLAEESVLTWPSVLTEDDEDAVGLYDDAAAQLAEQTLLAKQAKALRFALTSIQTPQTGISAWTSAQLSTLNLLLESADRDAQTLHEIHEPHLEHVNALQTHTEGVLREERERLEEAGKEIETLAAKLEYELQGLKGRIEDVGAGVQDFGKGVRRVEERIEELEREEERGQRGWFEWG